MSNNSEQSISTQSAKPRIEYIDTAKGICILLVVFLHSGLFADSLQFLALLRMPFYFTLSGLFFKDYGGFLPTVIKKINKIIIPFFFFYTGSYIIFVAIRTLLDIDINIGFFDFFTNPNAVFSVNIALWFLFALFWANTIFFILHRYCHNIISLGAISCALSVAALILFSGDYMLPLFIDSALVAIPFFFLGYCLRNTSFLYPNRHDRFSWLYISLLIAIAVGAYFLGESPVITLSSIKIDGSPIFYFIGAFAIVITTLLLCKKIGPLPFLKYIGRYSLIILGVHCSLFHISQNILQALGLKDSLLHDAITFITVIAISTLLIAPLTRNFPRFTAQRDLITWSPRKSSK